jgi:hypothetical protein
VRTAAVFAFLASLLATSAVRAADPVLLHAADSLRDALTDVAAAHQKATAVPVAAKFGASGLLRDSIVSQRLAVRHVRALRRWAENPGEARLRGAGSLEGVTGPAKGFAGIAHAPQRL